MNSSEDIIKCKGDIVIQLGINVGFMISLLLHESVRAMYCFCLVCETQKIVWIGGGGGGETNFISSEIYMYIQRTNSRAQDNQE